MKIPVASHSFLNDWANCPRKAYRKYIAKDLPKEPPSDAMKWGNDVHTAFEVRIKHGTPWPKGMEKFEVIAAPLAKAGSFAEKMLGIDRQGKVCDFFDKKVWLRGKIDCTLIVNDRAAIFDWKTGKKREDKAELETHAVMLKAYDPNIVTITAHYVWLQTNEVGKAHDVSNTEAKLTEIQGVMNQVANCVEEENFPPRPNPLCGGDWGSCPVIDCEHRRGNKR